MSAQERLLERLLDWLIGAPADACLQPARPPIVHPLEQRLGDRTRDVHHDHEREIELRVLMSSWM
jgi:hypothetical protein